MVRNIIRRVVLCVRRPGRVLGLAAALCLAAPAFAQDPAPYGVPAQTPGIIIASPSGGGTWFTFPGSRISDQGLAGVRGRGASETPHAPGQVAVILWDERGTPKTGGGDMFADQSTGRGNQQASSLAQN
ncbi:MAG: hypothetical protein ACYDB1_13090 [Acidiferrobacteraceae bacterium]